MDRSTQQAHQPARAVRGAGQTPGTPRPSLRSLSRRALLASGASALAGVVLASCAGTGTGSESSSASATVQTIRFAWWQQDYKPFWDQIVPKFTEKTKISIDYEFYTMTNNEWVQKLTAMFVSGDQPDVMHSGSMTDTRFYDAGNIMDLTPVVAKEKLNVDKDYALMGTEKWCGKLYALPYFAEPFGIYYNKTLLKELGQPDPWVSVKGDWTWDQMMSMAKLAVADLDRDGKTDRWGIHWPISPLAYFGPWAWCYGANFVDWDNAKYNFNNPGSIEAFQRYQNAVMRDKIVMHPSDATEVQNTYGGGTKNAFQSARVLFWFRSVTDIPRNRLQIGSNFEWDVLPVPKVDTSRPGVGFQAGHPNTVAAKTKKPDAATKFAMWLSQSESQEHMGETKFLMPALKSAWPTFLKGTSAANPPEHIQQFADVFKKPHGWHFRHHATSDSDALFQAAMPAVFRGEKPLVPTLQELDATMNQRIVLGQCAPYKGMKVPRPGSG